MTAPTIEEQIAWLIGQVGHIEKTVKLAEFQGTLDLRDKFSTHLTFARAALATLEEARDRHQAYVHEPPQPETGDAG